MANTKLFCTFHLGDLYLGVEVLKVQEVVRFQELTSVPLAPPGVSGLINLRGQIVTAIDLRHRIGVAEREAKDLPMNVVLCTNSDHISLLVDRIGDVVEVDERDFEPPPSTISEKTRSLIQGVYKLKSTLLLILDTEKITGMVPEDLVRSEAA
jgi:purine-binding chemotaxis protein CheW